MIDFAGVSRLTGSGVLVSKGIRLGFVGLLSVLTIAAVPVLADAGKAPHATGAISQKRLAQAADETSRGGFHAKLPPHISTLLGLSSETETPVMQSVTRADGQVKGFDVSVANKNDIVLFVVDEAANDQVLFLTSPQGALRKVVSVKAGVGQALRITDKERADFQKEKQFWVDRLAPASPAKKQ